MSPHRLCLTSVALSLLLIGSVAAWAPADETWTLEFKYTSEFAVSGRGNATGTDTATGSVSLQVNEAGEISGTGTVSATSSMTVPGVSSSHGTGQGPCTASGKADGKNLVFTLHGNIALKGQTTITVPGVAAMHTPSNSTLHCESIARDVVIERKNGATTNGRNESTMASPKVVITTAFSLSGGPATPTEPAPADLFPPDPDIWTLEMEYTVGGAGPPVAGHQEGHGTADFPLPLKDGPTRGEGPLQVTLGPPAATEKGTLHMDGRVKGDQLTFIVGFTIQGVKIPGTLAWRGNTGTTTDLDATKPEGATVMPLQDGAETTIDLSGDQPAPWTGKITFRLKGHRREQWLVLINAWDTHYRGSGRVVFGARVPWQVRVTIWLRDEAYESGSGQSSVGTLEPHSKPPGLYTMEPVPGEWMGKDLVKHPTPYVSIPSYNVTGRKLGGRTFELTFPKANEEAIYAVTYRNTLDLQVAQRLGIDLNTLKATGNAVVTRTINGRPVRLEVGNLEKTSVDRAIGDFPLVRTVTLTEGWHHEEGDTDSLDYEQITVTKLR